MSTELHHTRGQVAKDLCVRETKASLKGSKSRLGNRFTGREEGVGRITAEMLQMKVH